MVQSCPGGRPKAVTVPPGQPLVIGHAQIVGPSPRLIDPSADERVVPAAPYVKAIATLAAGVRASWGTGPWAGVTAGKLAGQVLDVVARARGRLEPGGDADGERVAADTGEVLAEQISGSRGLAGGCSGDHFDVMAFPVHRPASGLLAWCAGEGHQIGGGQGEAGVGADGQAQGCGGPVRAGGSLRPAVPRGRPGVGGDDPAVVLNRGSGGGQMIMAAGTLARRWLHDGQGARAA
jgi:hypothetical protein